MTLDFIDEFIEEQPDGTWVEVDRTDELLGRFRDAGIDALITVGGPHFGNVMVDRQARRTPFSRSSELTCSLSPPSTSPSSTTIRPSALWS